jgi:hypothetical protein|tara:strand:+ start:374 stop:523 length:150 start_codon:yes stop_codon:yes gene_type:complete
MILWKENADKYDTSPVTDDPVSGKTVKICVEIHFRLHVILRKETINIYL